MKRILLVDDMLEILDIWSMALRHLDCQVSIATDGIIALNQWKRAHDTQKPFDLIVLDIALPQINEIKMSGRLCGRVIRESDPDVKLVFLSAHIDDLVLADIKTLNPAAIWQKPMVPQLFAKRIEVILGP